ncbi:hypothetical protein [Flavobacterium sp. 3HN19-14]|uniref:hypothetical protein n=1 Tax=Flavobacterium sp. 3HN19-14 TaxID=3448133 RepID=UPI003EE0B487
MKKIFFLLFISFTAFAQVPQGISYQAIALNGSGNPVATGNVGIRLSLMDNAATGTVIYTETHTKTTNAQGLFNLVIGQGTVVSGTFAAINWGTNSKFLKVEIDAAGGTNYVAVGTTQLLSVPYAMYAGNTASVAGTSTINDDIINNKSSNFIFTDYDAHKVYSFNTLAGTWSFQNISAGSSPDLKTSNGNTALVDYDAHQVFAYNGKSGIWSSQNISAGSSPDIIATNGNFFLTDYDAHKVFSYSGKTGVWSSQNISSGSTPELVETSGNVAFVDYDAHTVYAYNDKNGNWNAQVISSGSTPFIASSDGSFAFVDYDAHKVFVFSRSTGVWSSQTISTGSSPTLFISNTN